MSEHYYDTLAEAAELDDRCDTAPAAYAEAAELFAKAGMHVHAHQCMLRLGVLAERQGDLARAADIFEDVGDRCKRLTFVKSFVVSRYLLWCVHCHLARGDTAQARHKLDKCKAADASFQREPRCALAERLIQACDEASIDRLHRTVLDFEDLCCWDSRITAMLRRLDQVISDKAAAAAATTEKTSDA